MPRLLEFFFFGGGGIFFKISFGFVALISAIDQIYAPTKIFFKFFFRTVSVPEYYSLLLIVNKNVHTAISDLFLAKYNTVQKSKCVEFWTKINELSDVNFVYTCSVYM